MLPCGKRVSFCVFSTSGVWDRALGLVALGVGLGGLWLIAAWFGGAGFVASSAVTCLLLLWVTVSGNAGVASWKILGLMGSTIPFNFLSKHLWFEFWMIRVNKLL